MPHRNSTAPFFLRSSRAPFREIALHLGIQIQTDRKIALDQFGDERSRGHHFGERSDVVFSLFRDGWCLRVVGQLAKSMKGNFAAVADRQRRPWKSLVGDRFFDDPVGRLQFFISRRVHGLNRAKISWA
jgi:hypothetical protein